MFREGTDTIRGLLHSTHCLSPSLAESSPRGTDDTTGIWHGYATCPGWTARSGGLRFKAGMAEGGGVFLQHTASQCRAVVSKQNLLSPHSVPGSVDSLGNETEATRDLIELTVWKGGTPQYRGVEHFRRGRSVLLSVSSLVGHCVKGLASGRGEQVATCPQICHSA